MSTAHARRVAVDGVGLAPGGGLTYLVNQARVLEAQPRWEPTYFVAPRSREALESVVDPARVRVPFAQPPSYVRRLGWEQLTLPRLLGAEGFDLLYAPGGFGVFRAPVPQLVVDHNAFHHAARAELPSTAAFVRFRLERWLARRSARRAEAVVYLSQSFADAMARVGFAPPTAIIGSGVSTDWPPGADSPLDCPACVGGRYVLGVHNWTPGKRLEWLLEAWRERPAGHAEHLVLVGRPAGGETEQRIRRLLNDPSVRESVHVFDAASRGQVARLYQQADVYVSAASLEAFPLTPYEAMHFGVPCVLSDIPEHREVAGDAGTYFQPGRPEAFWSALDRARAMRSELVERGRLRVAGATWSRNVDQLVDLFDGLVNASGEAQPVAGARKRSR